ncbi:hypothetical protein BKA57DRAFT_498970 [Linnemannia elongata]|nr:hypothetical protein BKA57DRAFT_498970 [Linnemannia elongata]
MRSKSEEQRQIYNLARTALIHNHNQQIGVPSRRLVEERAAAAAAAKNNYSKHLLLLDRLATRTQGTSQQQLYNHNKVTSSTPSTSTLCTRGATIARGRVRDGEPIKDVEMERVFELCPKTSDIMAQLQDFQLVLLEVLQNGPNVITSLEIVHGDGDPSDVLLRYLCVSSHFLHLKAPRVGIIVEDMDRLFSSHVDTTATAGSTTTVPKI